MITYRDIVPSQVMPDIYALLHAHWLETEKDVARGPAPSIDMYKACEDAGLTVAIGLFDDDVMVGYAVAFVHRHLHYDLVAAQHDSLFIRQDHRNGRNGINLIRHLEAACLAKDAQFIAWHAKKGSPFDKLLARMGYIPEEIIYRKELSCQSSPSSL